MLLRLLLILLLLPSLAHAAVDWDEGFEYANQTALESVWSTSCPGNGTIIFPSTTRAHSGSKSLKEHFGGHDVWSCFIDRNLSGSSDTLYSRFWMYMDNFTVDPTSTKSTLSGEACCYPSFWWVMKFGSTNLGVDVQGVILDNGAIDTQVVNGGAVPQNQWVCVETRLTMSTPGVDDGIVEQWINGTQTISKTNQRMRGATLNQGNSPTATFRFVRLYTQNGIGDIYYDDYAVSRNARIGCGSGTTPPPDITPPPAISGTQTINSTVPGTVNVSWTAITNPGDLAGYTARLCTGVSCTGGTTAGTVGSSATSIVLSGLTEATVVGVSIAAYDTSGNTSAYTSPVYITVASTPSGGASGSLSINSGGKFVLNTVQTFLQGISYFDGQNYRTSDIDTLSSRGFNNIRVFVNWAPDLYAGARSVCDAAGALNATRRNQLQALIDYAKTKNMTVTLVTLDSVSDLLMVTDGSRQTCLTNLINYYKPSSAQANWNVLFDVVQEHDQSAYADTTTKLKAYTDIAKAACGVNCIIYASATTTASLGVGPSDATAILDATMQANIFAKIVTNGESVLAVHEYRSANWYAVTGQRMATYKNYLTSIGRGNIPVIFDEPNRYGFTYSSTEAQFDQAAADAKASGGAMWVFHNSGSFDMSTLSMFQQLNATETAITMSMSSALSGGSTGTPTSLATHDFSSTAFATVFTGGYTGMETPNQTGGVLQAFSTSGESLAKYTGTQSTLTSLFTCTTANAGPPPSGAWTTLSGNGFKVISNQCGTNNASGASDDQALWNTSYSADQVFQATLAAVPGTISNEKAFLTWRIQSAGAYDNFYQLDIKKTGASAWLTRLFKVVAGVYTQLGGDETGTVANGDVYKVSAVGSTISAYRNGTLILTATDSSISGAGYVALGSWYSAGGAGGTVRWTNLAGGNYSAGFSTPTNHGATVQITTIGAGTGIQNGIAVGMGDSPTYNGNVCRWVVNPPGIEIIRKISGSTAATLASRSDVTLAAGDTVGCFKNGSTVYMTRGSVTSTPLLTATDSTYSGGGGTGLYLYNAGAAVGTNQLDNFTVYQYSAPATPCTPSITSVTGSTTGATVGYDASCPPTQYRVDTDLSTVTVSAASLPGGVYTRPGGWILGDSYTCVYAIDAQGTVNTTGYVCIQVGAFVPNPDVTAPVMTLSAPTSHLPFGTTSTTVTLTTDEAALCNWDTSNTTYVLMANLTSNIGLAHSFTATGLITGANLRYAQCQDLATTPNTTTTALTITITVDASTADTTAPTTVTSLVAAAISPTQLQITHDLATDAGGAVTYQAWLSAGGGTYTKALDYTGVPAVISGLNPNVAYSVKVLSIDSSLNPAAAYSNVATATTPIIPDTTPPSTMTNLRLLGTFSLSVLLTSDPGTDDKGTPTTTIELSPAGCANFQQVYTNLSLTFFIPNLAANTSYCVRGKFSDGTNVSTAYSNIVTFTTTTGARVLTRPRRDVPFAQPRRPRN